MVRGLPGCALMALAAPGAAQVRAAPMPATLPPASGEHLQHSAAVVKLTQLQRQGDATVKLFGTAGGDPAMNGLQTYLAFQESSADGWRVFALGDFLDYRLLSEAPGRIALQLQESVMDGRTNRIGSRTRRILVTWSPGRESEAPSSVRVTAVR